MGDFSRSVKSYCNSSGSKFQYPIRFHTSFGYLPAITRAGRGPAGRPRATDWGIRPLPSSMRALRKKSGASKSTDWTTHRLNDARIHAFAHWFFQSFIRRVNHSFTGPSVSLCVRGPVDLVIRPSVNALNRRFVADPTIGPCAVCMYYTLKYTANRS